MGQLASFAMCSSKLLLLGVAVALDNINVCDAGNRDTIMDHAHAALILVMSESPSSGQFSLLEAEYEPCA